MTLKLRMRALGSDIVKSVEARRSEPVVGDDRIDRGRDVERRRVEDQPAGRHGEGPSHRLVQPPRDLVEVRRVAGRLVRARRIASQRRLERRPEEDPPRAQIADAPRVVVGLRAVLDGVVDHDRKAGRGELSGAERRASTSQGHPRTVVGPWVGRRAGIDPIAEDVGLNDGRERVALRERGAHRRLPRAGYAGDQPDRRQGARGQPRRASTIAGGRPIRARTTFVISASSRTRKIDEARRYTVTPTALATAVCRKRPGFVCSRSAVMFVRRMKTNIAIPMSRLVATTLSDAMPSPTSLSRARGARRAKKSDASASVAIEFARARPLIPY